MSEWIFLSKFEKRRKTILFFELFWCSFLFNLERWKKNLSLWSLLLSFSHIILFFLLSDFSVFLISAFNYLVIVWRYPVVSGIVSYLIIPMPALFFHYHYPRSLLLLLSYSYHTFFILKYFCFFLLSEDFSFGLASKVDCWWEKWKDWNTLY